MIGVVNGREERVGQLVLWEPLEPYTQKLLLFVNHELQFIAVSLDRSTRNIASALVCSRIELLCRIRLMWHLMSSRDRFLSTAAA